MDYHSLVILYGIYGVLYHLWGQVEVFEEVDV